MEEILNEITSITDTYYSLSWNNGKDISELLKNLTCQLFYLEKYRSEIQENHNGVMFNFTGSVSAGKIKADKDYPELYMLRRVMNASYRVVDSMRSNISYIKKES